MQLQRAWLELNLRELAHAARSSPWSKLQPLGLMGLAFLKNRSMWVAAISLLMKMYRRRAHKGNT